MAGLSNIPSRTAGHICALLSALLFGLMAPMGKLVLLGDSIDGVVLATMRLCGAAALFWLTSLLRRKPEPIARRDWPALLGMSLCGMLINQYCYIVGLQFTAPINACVIGTSAPVFAFMMSAVFLKLPVTRLKFLGLVMAFIGALVLVLGSQMSGGVSGHPLGDVICLVSQFSAACYLVFFGNVLRRYHPVELMKWLFLISAVLALPFMADDLIAVPWQQLSTQEWAGALYVVIGGSYFSYMALIVGQRNLDPQTVSSYNYVHPVVAAVVAILLGVDVLTWQKVAAILLIACGVSFIGRKLRVGGGFKFSAK